MNQNGIDVLHGPIYIYIYIYISETQLLINNNGVAFLTAMLTHPITRPY